MLATLACEPRVVRCNRDELDLGLGLVVDALDLKPEDCSSVHKAIINLLAAVPPEAENFASKACMVMLKIGRRCNEQHRNVLQSLLKTLLKIETHSQEELLRFRKDPDASVDAFVTRALQHSPLINLDYEETELCEFDGQFESSPNDIMKCVPNFVTSFAERVMVRCVTQVAVERPKLRCVARGREFDLDGPLLANDRVVSRVQRAPLAGNQSTAAGLVCAWACRCTRSASATSCGVARGRSCGTRCWRCARRTGSPKSRSSAFTSRRKSRIN
jgi:hypothetical protein